MADDKSKRDFLDRDRVAGGEDYEVQYLAQEAGITVSQALALIEKHGNDRETLMREAKRLNA